MHSTAEKLTKLRQKMGKLCCNTYCVSISDPHLSEYVPDHYQIIEWLTGFTGSTASLVVTDEHAWLWVDSRYWEQAAREVSPEVISIMHWGQESIPNVHEWLQERNANRAVRLLIHNELVSIDQYEKFAEDVDALLGTPSSWLNDLWTDRPALQTHPIRPHRASVKSAREKLARLQDDFKKLRQTPDPKPGALLLGKLDDIAWLTNHRGRDIAYNPVFLSWAIVTEHDATLFCHLEHLSQESAQALQSAGWTLRAYETIDHAIARLCETDHTIVLDKSQSNAHFLSLVGDRYDNWHSAIGHWKAVKEPEEIDGIRLAMKRDARAIEGFIAELRQRLEQGEKLTENDAVDILHRKRCLEKNFITESFSTIAAVGANAALPHYEPKPGRGAPITPPCVLLVDSGAHYEEGTTDTTRVWLLGREEDFDDDLALLKRDYTAVLTGMQALASHTFPAGTCGVELDHIAREPIQRTGIDYGHGTGHGIGLTLNVHETPPTISPRETPGSTTPFEPGMIVSDEPGIYRPGRWGIRIENTLVCVDKGNGMLGFETLTQCEIDRALVLNETS